MSMQSREIRLAARPKGEPRAEDFAFANVELKNPGVGEVLVKNLYFSVDPYMRGRMNDAKSYVPPFVVGKAMEGSAVGVVAASRDESLPVGSLVLSMFGWREAYVAQARILQRLDASLAPPSTFLGLLGNYRADSVGWIVEDRTPATGRDRLYFWRGRRRGFGSMPTGETP